MCRGTLQYTYANHCFGCFGLLVCVLWVLHPSLGYAAAAPLTGDLSAAGRGATVDRVACGVSGLWRSRLAASTDKDIGVGYG